jgi:hypothetical protein
LFLVPAGQLLLRHHDHPSNQHESPLGLYELCGDFLHHVVFHDRAEMNVFILRKSDTCSQYDNQQDEKHQKERDATTRTNPGTGETHRKAHLYHHQMFDCDA